MTNIKENKLKGLIKVLAADFFSRASNRTSLITITDVEVHSRGRKAIILFTVMPEDQEKVALDFMHRQLTELREYIGKNARIMHVPYLEVAVDKGEKNRQKLDRLSNSTGIKDS